MQKLIPCLLLTLVLACSKPEQLSYNDYPRLYSQEDFPLTLEAVRGEQTAPGPLIFTARNSLGMIVQVREMPHDQLSFESTQLIGNLYWTMEDKNAQATSPNSLIYSGDSRELLYINHNGTWPVEIQFRQESLPPSAEMVVRFYDKEAKVLLEEYEASALPLVQDYERESLMVFLESKPNQSHLVSVNITADLLLLQDQTPIIRFSEANYGLSFFEWQPVTNADEYLIQIRNTQDDVILERKTSQTSYWFNDEKTHTSLRARVQAVRGGENWGIQSPDRSISSPEQIPQMRRNTRIGEVINGSVLEGTPLIANRDTTYFRTPYSFTPAGMLEQGTIMSFVFAESNFFLYKNSAFVILQVRHPSLGDIYLPSDALALDQLETDKGVVQLIWSVDVRRAGGPRLSGILRYVNEESTKDIDLTPWINRVTESIDETAVLPLNQNRNRYQIPDRDLYLDEVTASTPQQSTRKERWVNRRIIFGENILSPDKVLYPRTLQDLQPFFQTAGESKGKDILDELMTGGSFHLLVPLKVSQPSVIIPAGRRNYSLSLVFRHNQEINFVGTLVEEDLFYYPDSDRYLYSEVHHLIGTDFILSYAKNTQDQRIDNPVSYTEIHPRRPFRQAFLVD
jgi:hypothetical protein